MLFLIKGVFFVCYFVFSSQLMAKEPLEKLGFRDLMDPPPSKEDSNTKP